MKILIGFEPWGKATLRKAASGGKPLAEKYLRKYRF
jgi:hypothetical protein